MIELTKAVIPAAGRGTRFLPVTRAVPKEMLPVGRRPMIQYAVDEAMTFGIGDIYIVISPDKEIIRAYFSSLGSRYREKLHYLVQEKPRGLGDALLLARPYIEPGEPFAVLLPDNVIFERGRDEICRSCDVRWEP